MLAGLLSESIFVKKHKQESFMTRAYCITLLAIVVLSSFAGAAQNSAKRDDAEFDLVDVADFNLPLLDESMPAMFGQYSELCGFCVLKQLTSWRSTPTPVYPATTARAASHTEHPVPPSSHQSPSPPQLRRTVPES